MKSASQHSSHPTCSPPKLSPGEGPPSRDVRVRLLLRLLLALDLDWPLLSRQSEDLTLLAVARLPCPLLRPGLTGVFAADGVARGTSCASLPAADSLTVAEATLAAPALALGLLLNAPPPPPLAPADDREGLAGPGTGVSEVEEEEDERQNQLELEV